MIVEITGGTLELLDRLNVGRKQELTEALANTRAVLQDKWEGDQAKVGDLDAGAYRTDGETLHATSEFSRVALVMLAQSWTRSEQMPRTSAEWDAFDEPDDAPNLYAEVSLKAYTHALELLNRTAVVVSPETMRDPSSPTEPSSPSRRGRAGSQNPLDDPPQWIVNAYTEYRFRKLIAISHDEYLEEPADFAEMVMRFEKLDADVETLLIERMRREAGH